MSVYDLYKPLRNKLRSFSCADSLYVIWAYTQFLQFRKFNFPSDIEVDLAFRGATVPQRFIAEWELELIAKEIIINAARKSETSKTLRKWAHMASVVNTLKDLEGAIYRDYGPRTDIWIELNRIAHRQFVWQENAPNSRAATRYYKIFKDKRIEQICCERLNLTVRDIFLFGMALIGAYTSRPVVPLSYIDNLKKIRGEEIDVESFLRFTCKSEEEIKSILVSEQKYDAQFAYAYNSLKAYPLIRMDFGRGEVLMCPLPTIFFWRFTAGLYYEFVGDDRFSQALGESFQTYVGDLTRKFCSDEKFQILGEQTYGPKKARKDSADWIILENGSALFIECKAKRLSWDAKSNIEELDALHADIDHLANGVFQLYKTINDYASDAYEHLEFSKERTIFAMVVTFENWYLFGPHLIELVNTRLLEKLQSAGISEDILSKWPYIIASIADLEFALPVINDIGISEFMGKKFADTEMRSWNLHAYLSAQFSDKMTNEVPFAADYEEIFAGLPAT